MKRLIPILIACVCTCACDGAKEQTPEEKGQQVLNEARTAYAEGRFDAARDSILSLRLRYPMALEARRQAILLMDSVEYQLAEGDTLKQEFFRRKLEHDIKNLPSQ